jgi:hypothetical protein
MQIASAAITVRAMNASPTVNSSWQPSPGYQVPDRTPRFAFIDYLFGIAVFPDRIRPAKRGVSARTPDLPLFPFSWKD